MDYVATSTSPQVPVAVIAALVGLGGVLVGGIIQVVLALHSRSVETMRATRSNVVNAALEMMKMEGLIRALVLDCKSYMENKDLDQNRFGEFYAPRAREVETALAAHVDSIIPIMACGDRRVSEGGYASQMLVSEAVKHISTMKPEDWDEDRIVGTDCQMIKRAASELLGQVEPRRWERVARFRKMSKGFLNEADNVRGRLMSHEHEGAGTTQR